MDCVDELARKLISAFEELEEEVILEQLAVPEDLADPEGTVDLWVVIALATAMPAAETDDAEEELVVRATVSVPTEVALQWEAEELGHLFRKELLDSQQFRHASSLAGVAFRAAEEHGVPSQEEAEQN